MPAATSLVIAPPLSSPPLSETKSATLVFHALTTLSVPVDIEGSDGSDIGNRTVEGQRAIVGQQ